LATSRFHTTSWSLVAAAAEPTDGSRQALATLCQAYWQPVYAFIRRNGYDRDQACDLTQGFFTLMLEKNYLDDADQQRGRFRSFLLTAVKRFLSKERDRDRALKRGGGQMPVPINPEETEAWYLPAAIDATTPESLFERRWALSLLERVVGTLRLASVEIGKAEHFDRLLGFLSGDAESRYEPAAAQMDMSPGALRTQVHRLRRKYRELLRAEIAETVAAPEEIDEEIRFLLKTLST
jgi:DNA-directed RNA polymerase specialized sigma24 family protein